MSEHNKSAQPAANEPSRRTFLKTSTAAVAAGGLAATLGGARAVHAGVDDAIKIGLVGCGGRGTGAAAQALQAKGANVKLVAMGDAFARRLKGSLAELSKNGAISSRIDVPAERQFVDLDAYKKVLDCDIDLVILATPPGFRPTHLAAAVEKGKHVFMEKPVAVDAPGVRAVLAATAQAKQKKLAIGVGLQRHHQAGYIETIKRLQDGAIGDIVCTRVYWNSAGVWVRDREPGQTDMQYQVNNWYYFNWLSGDHIVEQHIHNLDVSNWLKNAHPVSAQGMGGRQVRVSPTCGEIFDHHAVEFEYADGTRMFSYCRHIPNCWDSVSEHAHGTKGSCDISSYRILPTGGEKWAYREKEADPYQVEHDDLFASILKGQPLNEGEYGATSSMTAILGRMATYTGKVVAWEQAIESKTVLGPKEMNWDAAAPAVAIAHPGVSDIG